MLGLVDDWSVQPLKICVRELDSLPGLARELVRLLLEQAQAAAATGPATAGLEA